MTADTQTREQEVIVVPRLMVPSALAAEVGLHRIGQLWGYADTIKPGHLWAPGMDLNMTDKADGEPWIGIRVYELHALFAAAGVRPVSEDADGGATR